MARSACNLSRCQAILYSTRKAREVIELKGCLPFYGHRILMITFGIFFSVSACVYLYY